MDKANIGLIGLAVMGQNLALNMNDHGFKVCVYNRTAARTDEFLQGPAKTSQVIASYSIDKLIRKEPCLILRNHSITGWFTLFYDTCIY